jgi:antitoxin component YwqK of YwqJK toxin-antitoxin module
MNDERDVLGLDTPDQTKPVKKSKWTKVLLVLFGLLLLFAVGVQMFGDKRQRMYYPDGKTVHSRGDFNEGGQGIGLHTDYREDGTKSYETNFNNNGNLDGLSTFWFDNGQLRWSNEYVDGVQKGEYKEYDREGNLLVHEIYDNDSLVEKIK